MCLSHSFSPLGNGLERSWPPRCQIHHRGTSPSRLGAKVLGARAISSKPETPPVLTLLLLIMILMPLPRRLLLVLLRLLLLLLLLLLLPPSSTEATTITSATKYHNCRHDCNFTLLLRLLEFLGLSRVTFTKISTTRPILTELLFMSHKGV